MQAALRRLTCTFRRALSALALLALIGGAPIAAQAVVITFDDLTCGTDGILIPDGYQSLNWDRFGCLAGDAAYGAGNSGYSAGVVSPENVAFNGFAAPAEFTITAPGGAKFNFNSVYLTGAWRDGLEVTIEAFRDGALVSTTTHTLSSTAPTQVTLDLMQIDRVRMSSAGGTQNPDYVDMGTHFAMDNLDIDFIKPPPPAGTVAAVPTLGQWSLLLLAGLLGATALRRRRRG